MPIGETKVADLIQSEKKSDPDIPVKLPIEAFKTAYQDKRYNEPTIIYLMKIYREVETNQVFGSTYLAKILSCSDRTARNLIVKLRDMGVITTVTGKGKGMYRFVMGDEL